MEYISHFFESIIYYIHLFFFATAGFTHIFKILLITQILFLVYTAFRPAKWKWISLFASEILFWIGSFMVLAKGFADDSLGILGYGAVASVFASILFFTTLGFSLRTPKPTSA